jgi:hypothetical protein
MSVYIYHIRLILGRNEPKMNSSGNYGISLSSIFESTGIHQVVFGGYQNPISISLPFNLCLNNICFCVSPYVNGVQPAS